MFASQTVPSPAISAGTTADRIQPAAVEALQEALEAHLVGWALDVHCSHVFHTLQPAKAAQMTGPALPVAQSLCQPSFVRLRHG